VKVIKNIDIKCNEHDSFRNNLHQVRSKPGKSLGGRKPTVTGQTKSGMVTYA